MRTTTLTKLIETDKIPAGSTNPNQFDVLEAWYRIYDVEDLSKSKLTRFTQKVKS